MTALRVHTARVSYRGPDRLDVTRKSAGSDGIAFAPSWSILRPMLRLRLEGPLAILDAWPRYVEQYTTEMRRSYVQQIGAWRALLARPEVTLVCYCTDPAHCHRTVLAGILTKLGATYLGERPARTARDREKRENLDWLGNAIIARAVRRERPHFRVFVVASDGELALWPRPAEATP